MLTKLLKYEFKATARTYGAIYLALLAAAGLIGISFRTEDFAVYRYAFGIGITVYSLLSMALVVVTIVTVIQRFTKNLLGREGYLMHTLPVTESQLVASKLLSSAVWLLASAAVGIVSLVVMTAIGVNLAQLDLSEFWAEWAELRTNFQGEVLWGLLWAVLLCYARVLCTILCIYAACMVGHLFRAHNGIASVAAFFLMCWAQGWVENLLNSGSVMRIFLGPDGSTIVSEVANQSMAVFFGSAFAVTAAFGAAYFALTTQLMKKKLNLS